MDRLVVSCGLTDRVLGLVLGGVTDRVLGLLLGGVTDRVLWLVLTRTVNGTGHTGTSEFCATSI